MQKILLFLLIVVSISCAKDDAGSNPKSATNYAMPFFSNDVQVLKEYMLKITPNVEQIQTGNSFKLIVKPNLSKTNMFSELVYEYTYKAFVFESLNFTYKIYPSINLTEDDKLKLSNHLKSSIILL